MTNQADCPVWGAGHKAIIHSEGARKIVTDSDRTGGGYQITLEAELDVHDLEPVTKALLTTWIIDQKRAIDLPLITRGTLSYIAQARTLSAHERAERLLRFIAGRAETVGAIISVDQDTLAAYAWSESTVWKEVSYFLVID